MTSPCHLRPVDKRKLIDEVGQRLVRDYGKRRHYTPAAVRRAAIECQYPLDVHCWALCVFSSPEDFKAIHDAAGEACDYLLMRREVLGDLRGGGASDLVRSVAEGTADWIHQEVRLSGADISWADLSWLDWPDIDWSGLFEWFNLS